VQSKSLIILITHHRDSRPHSALAYTNL